MGGPSRRMRDRLAVEMQSGAMTSGVATIKLHQQQPDTMLGLGWWPRAQQPTEGMLTNPSTGQSWRIRFNQATQQWEVVD
jgi:hypothetical protein